MKIQEHKSIVYFVLVVALVGSILLVNIPFARAEKLTSPNFIRERATASQWGWKFNDQWGIPHYGATFRGTNGADPNFTGPGGNDATLPFDGGIKNWTWWNDINRNSLLTPKSWVCYPFWICRPESRVPQNYNAIITR